MISKIVKYNNEKPMRKIYQQNKRNKQKMQISNLKEYIKSTRNRKVKKGKII